MPMLSFSHRTTAPAMATEPLEEQRLTSGLTNTHHGGLQSDVELN